MHPAVELEEHRVEVLGESFGEPEVVPIRLGHGVPEPLMHGLVGDEAREVLAPGRVLGQCGADSLLVVEDRPGFSMPPNFVADWTWASFSYG